MMSQELVGAGIIFLVLHITLNTRVPVGHLSLVNSQPPGETDVIRQEIMGARCRGSVFHRNNLRQNFPFEYTSSR